MGGMVVLTICVYEGATNSLKIRRISDDAGQMTPQTGIRQDGYVCETQFPSGWQLKQGVLLYEYPETPLWSLFTEFWLLW